MAYLQPDKTIKENGLVIFQKLTPNGYRKKPNQSMKVKGITIHNTDEIKTSSETNPAEQYARATYPNGNMGFVAVHYWIFKNIIWQQLRDNEQGWHAGKLTRVGNGGQLMSGNGDTISIEIIGSSKESEETGKKLTALLCKRHGLTSLDVYTHNFWNYGQNKIVPGVAKNCPLYILPHWKEFVEGVAVLLREKSTESLAGKPLNGLVKVIYEGADGLNVRTSPRFADNIDQVVTKGEVFTVTETIGDFYKLKSGLYLTNSDTYVEYMDKPEPPVEKSFLVKVDTPVLNIREGSDGTTTKVVGKVNAGDVFTIVEEIDGWGRLKSGAGWISLDLTERL